MSTRTIAFMVGAAIGIPGFAMVYCKLGWVATVGLLLAMWGNNIVTSAQSEETKP